jgi:hypothetical protein
MTDTSEAMKEKTAGHEAAYLYSKPTQLWEL